VVFKPTKSMLIAAAEEVDVVTFRVTLAECVSEPLVPVMVTVELLDGLPDRVVTVSVELPGALIGAGEKEAVAPVGKPDAAKLTEPWNPFSAPRFTV
jgi:hypothetical protein